MTNSRSSILPLFNASDTLISNTANADVTMSTNFVTFVSFFWYFLVSAVAMPLTLAPARETAPKRILTKRTMSVLRVATLDIPEGTVKPLEQAFSHVSRSKVLEYFSCFFLYLLLVLTALVVFLGLCLGSRIVGPREPKAHLG